MATRKAEILFIGDAASIVRAAKVAEGATARVGAAAKKSADETVAASDRAAAAQKKTATSAAAFSTGVVSAAKKAGEGLVALAGVSLWAGVNFQKSMELMHTQAGAPVAEIHKMTKAVLALGLTTEQGPNKLVKALYPIESVGMRGATAMAALSAASKGAAVGGADLTETTHALAGVMVALHQKGSEAAKTMGAIDAIVGVGKMHMQDFVDALSSGIVPTAHAVGLSFASIGAGLATLTDAGVPAEQAATKMRTILLMLAHEHTKAAVEGLKSVGLTAGDVASAMRKPGNGLLNVLELLRGHMSGLSKVKQVDLMSNLAGGSKSAGTLITLLDQVDRVKTKYGQISTLSGQFNSRVAAESETASHRIKVAWSMIQTAFTAAGLAMLPTVNAILGAVESFVNGVIKGQGIGGKFREVMVDAFTKVKAVVMSVVGTINDVVKSFEQGKLWVTALAGGIAGFVAGLVVLKTVTLAITVATRAWAIAMALVNIVVAANPIVVVGLAVAALVGAFILAYEKCKTFRDIVNGAFSAIKQVVGSVVTWLTTAFHNMITEINSWRAAWSVVTWIAVEVSASFGMVKRVITIAMETIVPVVKSALAIIGSVFNVYFTAAKVIVETVFRVITTAAKGFATEVVAVVRLVGDLLKGKWGAAWDQAKRIVSTAIGTMLSVVKTIFGEIPKAISSVGGAIFSAVKKIIMAPLSWIKGLFNTVYDIGKYLMQGLIKGIESLAGAVAGTLKGIVKGAWKGVTGFLGISSPSKLFHDVGVNTMQGLINGINSKVPDLTKARGSVLTTFSGLAKGVGTLMGGSASAVGKGSEAIYSAVKSMMSSLGGKAPKSPGLDISGVMASVTGAALGAVGAVGGLLGQHATGGVVSKPMIMVGEEAPQHPEFVLATNPSYRKRNLGLWAQAGQQLGVPGFAQGGIAAMTAEANLINSKHYPYVWGGGHNAGFTGPYDCSGSVSAVLHAAGLLNAPEVSGQLMNYGLPGPGAVTIYANPAHTFMSIMGKFFGTHGSSGAGWYAGSARPGFAVRHAPVGAGGSIGTPKVSGGGTYGTIAQNALKRVAGAANSLVGKAFASATAGGGIGGGDLGTFGSTRALGQQMMLASGWGMDQWPALNALWNQESGWNPSARNSSSGAAGIPQDITGNMHGGAQGQIAWGLNYIRGRYGSPAGAEAHENQFGWYAKGGVLPYVGSFRSGGRVPADGMAHVHQNETILPAYAKGGIASGGFLYPLDEALSRIATMIQNLQNRGAPNHNREIGKLTDLLDVIRREKINPPLGHNQRQIAGLEGQLASIHEQRLNVRPGKAGAAERKRLAQETLDIEEKIKNLKGADSTDVATRRRALANQTLTIEEKIKELKEKDKSAKGSLADTIKNLNLQTQTLTQLKGFREAIASIRDQVKGLTASAAQAWRTLQEGTINKAHDLAIKAVGSSPAALLLAAMQSQDATAATATQLSGLNKNLTDAQFLAAHSGGQTHLDALQQVKDAQAAIDAFNRQQTEQQLQDSIAADTKKADDAQAVALAGLDKQQADYQASLDRQLGALTNSLAKRTITYAAWAKDVNAVLAQYGLSASTDAGTEITLTLGPPKKAKGKKIARASGGPVMPGYVYRVGEQGPEDVAFGRPGVVMTAAQSRRGGTVHIEKAYFTGTSAARAFADRLAFRAAIGTA